MGNEIFFWDIIHIFIFLTLLGLIYSNFRLYREVKKEQSNKKPNNDGGESPLQENP